MKKFGLSSNHADLGDNYSASLFSSHHINKKKILTWTASALFIVATPAAVFAWSVDSNHLSNTSANPMVKADETTADSTSTNNDSSTSSDTSSTTPPVTNEHTY